LSEGRSHPKFWIVEGKGIQYERNYLSWWKWYTIVSTDNESTPIFERLLGDGSQWGLNFSYVVQENPNGLAEAFILGKDHIGDDSVCLILGDNIFYGHGLPQSLQNAGNQENGATIFAYPVRDPERYGIVEFDENGKVLSVEEKPAKPKSHYAIPGIYFYDNDVVEIASTIEPSPRGELEITDVNAVYLEKGLLQVEELGRGVAWLDAGTHHSLLQASSFVEALQERQGMMMSCPEEIAWRKEYIDTDQLRALAQPLKKNRYGQYLLELADGITQ